MNHYYELPQPVIFAHRGACAHAPENTLASFKLALEHGAPAIELDAKLTVDGKVFVHHDLTLDRTTTGTGSVKTARWDDLKDLDAGSHFDARFVGEKVPLLEQVFETVGKRLLINIELTNYATPFDSLVDHVAALVRRHGLEDWVIFSSFHPINLARIGRLLPGSYRGMLAFEGKAGGWARGGIGRWAAPQALHPYLKDVSAKLVAAEHARNRKVNVWTVNDPQDMRSLFAWGVDGIFTDDPALAKNVLAGA